MKELFGTDGMRGRAGEFPLNEETIRIVGASLTRQFAEKNDGAAPKFVIGRDTRESGEWIEAAFCAGADGARCISAGVITTPGVAFLTKELRADAGIVVSASHNPFQDNGIKIFLPTGRKVDQSIERRIEQEIRDSAITINPAQNVNQKDRRAARPIEQDHEAEQLQRRYLNYLADQFSNLSLSGLKIVVDCANGAAFRLAPQLFRRLGANVAAIFNRPDGRNINADCGSLHIENLRRAAIAEKADFGVAFDGDADRALFVDANGEFVDGDATLWAMANHLRARGELANETVVATVMSNLGLEIALKENGMILQRTKVGDKYVLEELLKTGAALGGEQSGHIIFPQRSLVGDGMITALALLEAMQAKNARLSDLTRGFVRFPQVLVNVPVREKPVLESVPKIAQAAKEIEIELAEKGRLLLRYSGTELLARVMIEGENQNEIDVQALRLAAVIKAELG